MEVLCNKILEEEKRLAEEEKEKQKQQEKELQELIEQETKKALEESIVSEYCPCCSYEIDGKEVKKQLDEEPITTVNKNFDNIPSYIAYKKVTGNKLTCPSCKSTFIINEKSKTYIGLIPITIVTLLSFVLISFCGAAYTTGVNITNQAAHQARQVDYAIRYKSMVETLEENNLMINHNTQDNNQNVEQNAEQNINVEQNDIAESVEKQVVEHNVDQDAEQNVKQVEEQVVKQAVEQDVEQNNAEEQQVDQDTVFHLTWIDGVILFIATIIILFSVLLAIAAVIVDDNISL